MMSDHRETSNREKVNLLTSLHNDILITQKEYLKQQLQAYQKFLNVQMEQQHFVLGVEKQNDQISIRENMLVEEIELLEGSDDGKRRQVEIHAPEDFNYPATLILNREQLEVFSQGKISSIFGSEFSAQDQYPVHVRLPVPPLLLCDRITRLEGKPGSMGNGLVWSETDIKDNSWYLCNGRMSAGPFLEAGQAHLLLISWLGADTFNQGMRACRLLGSEIVFHGPLPKVGQTLKYQIKISGHAAMGEARIYFFDSEGWVDGERRVSIRNGQAGFFTKEELARSSGVFWNAETAKFTDHPTLEIPGTFCQKTRFSHQEVECYRNGNVYDFLGKGFEQLKTHTRTPLSLVGENFFVDEITSFVPHGGPKQRGYMAAYYKVDPDSWFFKAHFKDDPCMPGTFMWEGCMQAMSMYMAAIGFTKDYDGWRFEPVPEQKYTFLCRGQVTPASKVIAYEVFIDEIIATPYPTIFAHIVCTVDGLKAFVCERMGLRLIPDWPLSSMPSKRLNPDIKYKDNKFDQESIMQGALGQPSLGFGESFKVFDDVRRMPRLPGPPYLFMTRIANFKGKVGTMSIGSQVAVEYDIPTEAWFYQTNSNNTMPFCIMLEIALQACGWLAIAESAPVIEQDVLFRNLDGKARIFREITPDDKTVSTHVILQTISNAGNITIQSFRAECFVNSEPILELDTVFGFFPPKVMLEQKGLQMTESDLESSELADNMNLTLTDSHDRYFKESGCRLPVAKLLMLDRITGYWPNKGKHGKGLLRAEKAVDASDWFFKAHFFQDPVQPGSLGIEAILQLFQFYMLETGLDLNRETPWFEPILLNDFTEWHYRGQVVPDNKKITVEIEIEEQVDNDDDVYVSGSGRLWVDGLKIYDVPRCGMRIRGKRVTERGYQKYLVSAGQEGIWLQHQNNPDNFVANIPAAFKLGDNVSIDKLKRCIQDVIAKHPILLSNFKLEKDILIRVVDLNKNIEVELKDSQSANFTDLQFYLKQLIEQPFDLEKDPLIRATFCRYEGNNHVLLFVVHHIVFDGTSLPILLNEIRDSYHDVSSDLKWVDTMNNYELYAQWQKDFMFSRTGKEQLAYWIQELSGDLPKLDLLSWSTPHRQTKQGSASMLTELEPSAVSGLKNIAKQTGVSLFSLFLTGFKILLSRYSGQKDIIVGIPFSGRKETRFRHTLGYLVNLLAIRTSITANMTLSDLSVQVNKKVYNAIQHGDYPFEEMARELNPRRINHSNPIFQTSFAFQNWANIYVNNTHYEESNLVLNPIFEIHDFTPDLLSVEIIEYVDKFILYFKYDANSFEEDFISQMMQHYKNILGQMEVSLDNKLESIELLTEEEAKKILHVFNDTNKAYPRHKPIQQLFEEQVMRTPNKIALVFGNQCLTYSELNERANSLAHLLREKGVGPDIIVGLMVKRSMELMISIIAILKAGGAYLPIDPDYPEDRIRFMLSDTKVELLLTQAMFNKQDSWCKEVMLVDHLEMPKNNKSNPKMMNHSNDLIYVIYTSGSTGKPKGVLLTHANVNNFLHGMTDRVALSPSKTILCVTTVSFDIFVLETLLPLTKGLKVVLANEMEQRDPVKLKEVILNNNVDMIQMTPSRIGMLLGNHSEALQHLSEILIGGEALPQVVLEKLQKITHAKLFNMYGPTETTVWSTIMELTDTRVLIGKPINNTQIYVLDQHKQPVPCGIIGELYISGDGLARGYLNQPELTAEKFLANPFVSGAKMYHTGDLARWLPDGNLEFLGRIDHQVKIRGYRIEVGEIETMLAKHPAIKEAVVIPRIDDSGSQYLCAYLVCTKGLNVQEARAYLIEKLPEYMVPSYIVQLTELPLTPNGKIDRKSLPEPEVMLETGANHSEPDTEIEQQLISIWQEILKIDRLGTTDNFFEIGGHSLKAVILANTLSQLQYKNVSVRDIFKYPTIKDLGDYLTSTRKEKTFVDLQKEAILDEDIKIGKSLKVSQEVKNILFTGSTGFVGGFILKELLTATDWNIYCLVRAKTKEDGQERIKQHLINYELWDGQYADRIVPVIGDIGKRNLGVIESEYEALSEKIDMILHNATFMNHLATYEILKPINIGGLEEVLRFAVLNRLKSLQYISTMSIFNENTPRNSFVIDEESPIEDEVHETDNGYEASKWVAEKIVDVAMKRGVPCNIYRLGLVTGDCDKGRYSKDQWLYQLVQSCFTINSYFKELETFQWPITPVDFVSKSIVYLSKQNQLKNRVFHLINNRKVPISELFKNQTTLTQLELYDWLQRVKSLHLQGKAIPILPLIKDYLDTSREDIPEVTAKLWPNKISFQNEKTLNELEKGHIKLLVMNDELLSKYVQFIKRNSSTNDSN
jgi:amino acid adenylation domain-containing protein/thioester reductase-like protein